MGYHVIDPAALDPEPDRPSDMRYVSEAAGLQRMGLRVYQVAPGEEIPRSGLHYHDEQEEVFYVVAGELQVETPDQVYRVPAGQFFIAEPESPHRAHVAPDAATDAEVIGIGAPLADDAHRYEG